MTLDAAVTMTERSKRGAGKGKPRSPKPRARKGVKR